MGRVYDLEQYDFYPAQFGDILDENQFKDLMETFTGNLFFNVVDREFLKPALEQFCQERQNNLKDLSIYKVYREIRIIVNTLRDNSKIGKNFYINPCYSTSSLSAETSCNGAVKKSVSLQKPISYQKSLGSKTKERVQQNINQYELRKELNGFGSSSFTSFKSKKIEANNLLLQNSSKIQIEKGSTQIRKQCSICFEWFKKKDKKIVLECTHAYHIYCLERAKEYSNKCAQCRMVVQVDEFPVLK